MYSYIFISPYKGHHTTQTLPRSGFTSDLSSWTSRTLSRQNGGCGCFKRLMMPQEIIEGVGMRKNMRKPANLFRHTYLKWPHNVFCILKTFCENWFNSFPNPKIFSECTPLMLQVFDRPASFFFVRHPIALNVSEACVLWTASRGSVHVCNGFSGHFKSDCADMKKSIPIKCKKTVISMS